MVKDVLRVLAVSAPHWAATPADCGVKSFTAADPFSLQNACRYAAASADRGEPGWGESNWRTIEGRTSSVLLYQFADHALQDFGERLATLRPNLVLIGSMTLGLPGAITLAREARRQMGENCLVALGGKHCFETMNIPARWPMSPLALMSEGYIRLEQGRPLFDVVVSGQGEDFIRVLGQKVHKAVTAGRPARDALEVFGELRSARGSWKAGRTDGTAVRLIEAAGVPLDFGVIPTAPAIFGSHSRFPIFENLMTGHAFSDMGLGCRYDCYFCSERSGVNGKLTRAPWVVDRLLQHLTDIWHPATRSGSRAAAAFVEDSILLSGDLNLINMLIDRLLQLRRGDFRLRIGCQLTVNDILKLSETGCLNEFRRAGIEYVAFGMETVNEAVAIKMSKHRGGLIWTEKNRRALEALHKAHLRSGVFVLWGLGEIELERYNQLETLKIWRQSYGGEPRAIGLNWATLHPGVQELGKRPVNFLEWGTPADSEYLPFLVRLFGEASERYCLADSGLPDQRELRRLERLFDELTSTDKN